jgi:hypothetical protein
MMLSFVTDKNFEKIRSRYTVAKKEFGKYFYLKLYNFFPFRS